MESSKLSTCWALAKKIAALSLYPSLSLSVTVFLCFPLFLSLSDSFSLYLWVSVAGLKLPFHAAVILYINPIKPAAVGMAPAKLGWVSMNKEPVWPVCEQIVVLGSL